MNIEIDLERGIKLGGKEITNANCDSAFMRKIFEWQNRQHEQGNKVGASAGFHILSKGHCALIAAIEEILGGTQEELTITLRVKGKPNA